MMNAQEGELPQDASGKHFFAALKEAGLIGIWTDRDDIVDSTEFARQIRQKAWN